MHKALRALEYFVISSHIVDGMHRFFFSTSASVASKCMFSRLLDLIRICSNSLPVFKRWSNQQWYWIEQFRTGRDIKNSLVHLMDPKNIVDRKKTRKIIRQRCTLF